MTDGASNQAPGGVSGVQDDPRQASAGGFDAGQDPTKQQNTGPDSEDEEKEEVLVDRLWKEYDDARKFDENYRKQVAVDRRYAAGTSDLSWAVTTNLIGAEIDILTAILYARNPDVSVRKAEQVDNSNTQQLDQFAKTLEIIISKLWMKGKLKRAAKKDVRSILSTGEGWLKCTMIAEQTKPEVETALNDARETLARLQAQKELLEDPDGGDPTETDARREEVQELIDELEGKVELTINRFFAIDFIATENFQCSTDVASVADHLDADWNANEMYICKDEALARFERLEPDDLKGAKQYYQRAPKDMTTRDIDNVLPQGMLTAESAQAFTTSQSDPTAAARPFLRVVEVWDRRDKHIKTIIDGVKKWAEAPYLPPYPTSRFYPYFGTFFYEVDGQRHAQSLSWRLYKLQDEYSMSRSNFRLTRERSIPGVLFNATMLDDAEARKLQESKHQEYTALRPSDPQTPLANLFAPKPVAGIDMRVFDPTYILNDIERVAGVQEALQSAITPGNPITATEANIQQSGTAARTNSDRDALEGMLADLAQYTAEQALQCLTIKDAQRYAGPKAFWPGPQEPGGTGMSIDDLFTMVEIDITAGSTGKPKAPTDQQAWATILPLIKQTLVEIEQALGTGNLAMANVLIELVKETMKRLGDETDPDRFIPQTPPPGSPGAGARPPPIPPNVNVSLKGVLDPQTSAELVTPALVRDGFPPPAPPPMPGPPGVLPGVGAPPGIGPPPGATPPPGAPVGANAAPMPNMPVPGPHQIPPAP